MKQQRNELNNINNKPDYGKSIRLETLFRNFKNNKMKLGDLVYYITKYTGIRYVWKKIFPGCKCDERRKKWNKIKL